MPALGGVRERDRREITRQANHTVDLAAPEKAVALRIKDRCPIAPKAPTEAEDFYRRVEGHSIAVPAHQCQKGIVNSRRKGDSRQTAGFKATIPVPGGALSTTALRYGADGFQ